MGEGEKTVAICVCRVLEEIGRGGENLVKKKEGGSDWHKGENIRRGGTGE